MTSTFDESTESTFCLVHSCIFTLFATQQSMSDEAESSGQALEKILKQQLSELSIEVPEDDLEMMARFVEEEGLEKDEKVEGVRAMLEGFADVSCFLWYLSMRG
jgi:hypothetical protein